MSLLDFFKPKEKTAPSQENIPANRPECDISKTHVIVKLFSIPPDKRDEQWYRSFYQNVATASFAGGTPQVLTGPDGFPYFILRTPEANQPFESFCIQNMKDDFLLQRGWGVVFNPDENKKADWVFTHGDVVSLHLNNEFNTPVNEADIQNIEFTKTAGLTKAAEQVMIAQPSAAYLPLPTRGALKQFLQSKGIKKPMVMLLSSNSNGRPVQKLAFNISPENYPVAAQLDHLMQQVGWFLPRHYLIIPLSKNSGLSDGLDYL